MPNKLHYIFFVNPQYGVQKKYNKNRTKLFFYKKFDSVLHTFTVRILWKIELRGGKGELDTWGGFDTTVLKQHTI